VVKAVAKTNQLQLMKKPSDIKQVQKTSRKDLIKLVGLKEEPLKAAKNYMGKP
jgi:hypothetical protein